MSQYRTIWTVEQWQEALNEADASEWLGLDFEARPNTGFDPMVNSALRPEFGAEIVGIAIAWLDADDNIRSAYAACRHNRLTQGNQGQLSPQIVIGMFRDFMAKRRNKYTVVHNLQMELGFMLAEHIQWPEPGFIHDTQVAARVLNKGVSWKELIGLKALQQAHLGRKLDSKNELDHWLIEHRLKPGRDIWMAPIAIASRYAQDDSRDCLQLFLDWKQFLLQDRTEWWWSRGPNKANRKDLYELEIEAAIHSVPMTLRGARFDRPLARRRSAAADVLQAVCSAWVREHLHMPALNPGSVQQMKYIVFGRFGLKGSTAHCTDSFLKLTDNEQSKIVSVMREEENISEQRHKAKGEEGRVRYQYSEDTLSWFSLDVDALEHYADQAPEYSDLFFMMAVYRKCNTAKSWFTDRVSEFGGLARPDPFWDGQACVDFVDLMYHRLKTVGTVSGRMASADYNMQQVPKRFKMLIAANRLIVILTAYLPANQLTDLIEMLDLVPAKSGDEAKSLRVQAGEPVVDMSVRRLFIPRKGSNMRLHDLSQVEMRGFAHFSGNPLLCQGYGNPMDNAAITRELGVIKLAMDSGSMDPILALPDYTIDRHSELEKSPFDIHAFVADQLGISRKAAKGINFGIVYGMGKKKLGRSLGWSAAEAAEYLGNYHGQFPEISSVQERIKAKLLERGFIFDSFGRRYYLPSSRAYVGLNRLIQGWAASAFKLGYVRMCDMYASSTFGGSGIHRITRRPMPEACKVLACIHDENMSEIHTSLDTRHTDWAIRTCMTAAHDLLVPLGSSSERSSIEHGNGSWDEAVEAHFEN